MKKIISTILCAALLCSTACTVSAADTENVPSRWAKEYVEQAADLNIYSEKELSIDYQKFIDRESYCELAYSTLERADLLGDYKASADEKLFKDTQNEKVYVLNKMGIIKGKGHGAFAPADSLTREEAATILFRMLKYTDYLKDDSYIEANSQLTRYRDDKIISDWAYDAVYEMLSMGIMIGTGNGFEPKNSYTGEQAITTMVRIMEFVTGSDPETAGENSFASNMNALMPQNKNYMFSPLSIKMAMAMMANGASGETQSQILDATGIQNIGVFNMKAQEMIRNYSQSEILKLNVANSLWINSSKTDLRFSEDYESCLRQFYNAESGIVTSDDALEKVNGWVNKNTNGKIPSILDKNDFHSIIVNAVYFKGQWQSPFEKQFTDPDTFTDRSGKQSQIDFMNKISYMRYAKTNGVSVVELPYKTQKTSVADSEYQGVDVSMFLLMSDGTGFNPESVLTEAELSTKYVNLFVPKFKIEYASGISEMLKKLGIEKAFTANADFRKMYDNGNTYIEDAIHKTYITVDEQGTEAAAVTGIVNRATSIPAEPIIVKYNKPFTFVIMDKTNHEILFMGEYAYAE